MITFREIASGLKKLELDSSTLVIAHASLSAFGDVRGGVETMLGALLAAFKGVMMPAFTYKTMLIPEDGPEDNGLIYGSGRESNLLAEFFRPEMPADPALGLLADALRRQPHARRSSHPILSFSGINVGEALQTQKIEDPLAPIGALEIKGGWVLLMGVGHTANTSIHYAEKLAGRKQFVRWALTSQGVCQCPGWPGCSDGFESVGPWLESITRQVEVGPARLRALPLRPMLKILIQAIHQDPNAFLCSNPACERCAAALHRGFSGGHHPEST
jgi:aminoglycoside 3-N-acetyltransferase